MKGYKATDLKMQCRGMQYEVGGVYHIDGEIVPCQNGLHFCEHVKDVFNYYGCDNSRVFEVEASGTIAREGDKCAASDLIISRELSRIEINLGVYGEGCGNGEGYGSVYDYGFGNGCCYGYGDGNDNNYGNGYGDGYGNGCGNGGGNGYGYGYGNGFGYDNGNGYGYGYGIQKILVFV